jgi:hypothetical protein
MAHHRMPLLALLALCAAAEPARAQSDTILRVKPELPSQYQPVNIEFVATACGLRAWWSMDANVITLSYSTVAFCSPPPQPAVYEASLGGLPAGDYQVVLSGSNAPPVSFTVGGDRPTEARAMVQTGVWWDPRFPGTGVTVIDVYPGRRVVSLSTHTQFRTPVSYTMVLERGQSSGTLFRTESSPAATQPATPDAVQIASGRAALREDTNGTLVFDYTIDPLPAHQLRLERYPL